MIGHEKGFPLTSHTHPKLRIRIFPHPIWALPNPENLGPGIRKSVDCLIAPFLENLTKKIEKTLDITQYSV
jgi:hypothetical protein